jgi:hypothetical protein
MAPKKKAMPKTYKGKSTKPGGGGHFAMVVDALKKQGKSTPAAKAIAAAAGRKKYGKAKFQKFAINGKKRANKKKK